MKLEHAVMLTGGGIAAAVLAKNIPGESSVYVRAAGFFAAAIGAASLAETLFGEKPAFVPVAAAGVPDEPVIATPGAQYIALEGSILSPAEGETLHARQQLTLDGTYPVVLEVENHRDSAARGYVRLDAIEETIFGPAIPARLISPPLDVPPNSFQRFTVNMPAASGRLSLAINVYLSAAFVEDNGRERNLVLGRKFVVA